MTNLTKARYIAALSKSVGKPLEYAVGIAVWYTMTDKEQAEVERLIKEIW